MPTSCAMKKVLDQSHKIASGEVLLHHQEMGQFDLIQGGYTGQVAFGGERLSLRDEARSNSLKGLVESLLSVYTIRSLARAIFNGN
jgi:hypothetical protein